MYPTSFNIYKKTAAAQFTLLKPRRDENGRIQKPGAILLEMAPSKGEKSYDWNQKIYFAFGLSDLTQFFDDPNNAKWGKFFHKNGEINKKLVISHGEGRYEGTYTMNLYSEDKRIMVSLTGGEFTVLTKLFASALPKLIGW